MKYQQWVTVIDLIIVDIGQRQELPQAVMARKAFPLGPAVQTGLKYSQREIPMTRTLTSPGPARLFYWLGAATLLLNFAYVARGILIPLIAACFACFLIYTLKETIKNGPLIGRFLPNFVCYLVAFSLIGFITIIFVEIIRSNVEALITAWPEYENRLSLITSKSMSYLRGLGVIPEDFVVAIETIRATGLKLINPALQKVGQSAQSLTSNFVTIFLYTAFMLLERGRIFSKIALLTHNDSQRAAVNDTISQIGSMVGEYITVKTLTNLITAGISYTILRLTNVDFAGFWALLIFVLNYIPIVGAISAITLPVTLALVQPDGGGLQKAAITLGLLVGAEQTMSSLIEPRLIGRTLNLSPLIILLSLGVWGAIWGFAGALMAVPITVTIMIIFTQFNATRPIAVLLSDNVEIAPIGHGHLDKSSTAS